MSSLPCGSGEKRPRSSWHMVWVSNVESAHTVDACWSLGTEVKTTVAVEGGRCEESLRSPGFLSKAVTYT